MNCPSNSGKKGCGNYSIKGWRKIANDESQPEWLRKFAKLQVDSKITKMVISDR